MLTFASFAPIIAGFINDAQGWQWVLVCLLRIDQKLETNTTEVLVCDILWYRLCLSLLLYGGNKLRSAHSWHFAIDA